jgi:hypothetical protein
VPAFLAKDEHRSILTRSLLQLYFSQYVKELERSFEDLEDDGMVANHVKALLSTLPWCIIDERTTAALLLLLLFGGGGYRSRTDDPLRARQML